VVPLRHQRSGVEHYSQATIHVNSFTVPSGNFHALRKLEYTAPPPPPPPQYFHSLPSHQPGIQVNFLPGIGKVRKFLPGSAGRATHVDTGPGRASVTGVQGAPAAGYCSPHLSAGLALQRGQPVPSGAGEEGRGALGRAEPPRPAQAGAQPGKSHAAAGRRAPDTGHRPPRDCRR
jgi:hypothetical protein